MNAIDPKVFDMRFDHPTTFVLCGPSASGKSFFVKHLIQNADDLFKKKIERIVWVHSTYQPLFKDPSLRRVEFTDQFDHKAYHDCPVPTLIILDDMAGELVDSKDFVRYFTESRHWNLSVVFVTHHLFMKGKFTRTISLNTKHIVFTKQTRDTRQLMTLAQQMFANEYRYATDAFAQALKEPFSYVLVDARPECDPDVRIRSKIFPHEWRDNAYAQEIYKPV